MARISTMVVARGAMTRISVVVVARTRAMARISALVITRQGQWLGLVAW